MIENLLARIFVFFRAAHRKEFLKNHRCDLKCPNCNEWFSTSGITHKHSHVSKPDFGYHLRCGKCNYESYWNAVAAPILLLSDCNGNPL